MKKFYVISLIIFLVLFTAVIKNSTKRFEDEIFASKESIRILEKGLKDLELEFTYLSSGKRLMSLQSKFFEDYLVVRKKKEIEIIDKSKEKMEIKKLEIFKNE
tara:strand:- start:50 stop:358 length:309 start_codon:yes stop_codon:yes gene_type:complete